MEDKKDYAEARAHIKTLSDEDKEQIILTYAIKTKLQDKIISTQDNIIIIKNKMISKQKLIMLATLCIVTLNFIIQLVIEIKKAGL